MMKQFKDLAVGEVFRLNNAEYKKVDTVKISCCASINAEQVQNPSVKAFLQQSMEVEVNDQL